MGLELAIKSDHRAVGMTASGQFLRPVFKLRPGPGDLESFLNRARQGVEADHPGGVIMKPTS